MKYLKPAAAVAAALSMSAAPVHSGGLAQPVMEPEVIAEESAATSTGGFVLPLFLLVILAAVASSSDAPDE